MMQKHPPICVRCMDVAPPPPPPKREDTTPHRADTGARAARRRTPAGAGRAARLHPRPGRRSTWDQPHHPHPPPAIHRHDRDALGHHSRPRRRARTTSRRTTPPPTRAAPAETVRPAGYARPRGRRTHPHRARRRKKLRRDRAGTQRGRCLDRPRRPPVVAVDGTRRSRRLEPANLRRNQQATRLSRASSLDRHRAPRMRRSRERSTSARLPEVALRSEPAGVGTNNPDWPKTLTLAEAHSLYQA